MVIGAWAAPWRATVRDCHRLLRRRWLPIIESWYEGEPAIAVHSVIPGDVP